MKLEGLRPYLYDWTPYVYSPNIFCPQFGYLESSPLRPGPSTTFLLERCFLKSCHSVSETPNSHILLETVGANYGNRCNTNFTTKRKYPKILKMRNNCGKSRILSEEITVTQIGLQTRFSVATVCPLWNYRSFWGSTCFMSIYFRGFRD